MFQKLTQAIVKNLVTVTKDANGDYYLHNSRAFLCG